MDDFEWLLSRCGSFFSTVQDLAKWDAALDGNRILSESSRRLMWTRATLNDGSSGRYGLGWYVDELEGHRRVLINLDDNNIEAIADGVATIYLQGSSPAR